MTRVPAPLSPIRVDPSCSLAVLCEQYRRHALSVRCVAEELPLAAAIGLEAGEQIQWSFTDRNTLPVHHLGPSQEGGKAASNPPEQTEKPSR